MDAPMMEAMPPAAMGGMDDPIWGCATRSDGRYMAYGDDAPTSNGRYGCANDGSNARRQLWAGWMLPI